VTAELFRIGDRQLPRRRRRQFLNQLSDWETDEIEAKSGVKDLVRLSVTFPARCNREITTAIPVGALEDRLEPGAYILTAEAINRAEEWAPESHPMVRRHRPRPDHSVRQRRAARHGALARHGRPGRRCRAPLVAVNNEVLGEARTDPAGIRELRPRPDARHGRHGARLLVAQGPAGDYSFLDLSRAPMDLTDRGVEGREPPKPLDVFLTTERGIYRAGETVYATALVRDATANAMPACRSPPIVTRPTARSTAALRCRPWAWAAA
jgi:uncharacterized protein YfaS (alpha-2-macroglobulin family)